MWIFAAGLGFFSIVVDAERAGHLLVRARDRADALRLAAHLGLDESAVRITPPPCDYRYKLSVDAAELAVLFAEEIADITYGNFKREVARVHGRERADIYHDVWAALLPLQATSERREPR